MDYIFDIVLMKGPPWGFRMTGGKDFNSQLRISMVIHGSEAQEQQVLPDDRILEINSVECAGLTHSEAQQEIKRSGETLMLTLARKTDLGIQPKVQHEVKPRVEWHPPPPQHAEKAATKAMEKRSTAEQEGRMMGKRESPEGEEQGIMQGRTFKMLQKATENPDGQVWASRLSSGWSGNGGEKKGSTTAPVLRHEPRPQQTGASSIRRPVVEVKAAPTQQTTILMSDEPPRPVGQEGSETRSVAGASSSPPNVHQTAASSAVPSHQSAQATTKERRISEEISPWLQKSDNGVEHQESAQPSASNEGAVDNDDEQPIRQGRTFRLLAQATTNNPSADAYKAVFEEGKLSRAHKK